MRNENEKRVARPRATAGEAARLAEAVKRRSGLHPDLGERRRRCPRRSAAVFFRSSEHMIVHDRGQRRSAAGHLAIL